MPSPITISTNRSLLPTRSKKELHFYTTKNGNFEASVIVKSGAALPVWYDTKGNVSVGLSCSFAYVGTDVKVVSLYSPDGLDKITRLDSVSMSINKIENFEYLSSLIFVVLPANNLSFDIATLESFNFSSCYLYLNNIYGDIASIARWRPGAVYLFQTSVYGNIASLSSWRPGVFSFAVTNITGDIASVSSWLPTEISLYSTTISGDIATLSSWRPTKFIVYDTNITCSGVGGATMAANASMTQYIVSDTLINSAGINAIVLELWNYRTNGAGLTINLSGVVGVLTADSVARIEGTGVYAGNGIKTYGATVVYTAP